MKTTGVAVIGAGGIGTLRAHSCAQIPQVDYLAVCDIVPEKLDRLAESVRADVATEKYEVAIRDERVGAVIVSSDEEYHHGPAALAAELGKPVLIEKPFVLDLDEADDILTKADASGAEIFVGYTQRYRRRFLLAKQAAFAGQLGDIVMALGKIYVTRAVGEAGGEALAQHHALHQHAHLHGRPHPLVHGREKNPSRSTPARRASCSKNTTATISSG